MKKHLLSALAATALLASACSDLKKPEEKDQLQEATTDTAVVARDGATVADAATNTANAADAAWDMTKATLANETYEEIDLPEISVRGDDRFSVYGLEETVLFDTDKAEIKPTATRALSEIAASVGRRYGKSQVRVMGFADSRGDKSYNRELSAKRAEAVKKWLSQNGGMGDARVSIEPMGETAPVASNATAEGRQQNRRVEIAVIK
ncbi:OmpA family protein [Microvirga sp. STR05]|uniref:OmpA family protein n=1 Tax=Hymenobacter duratus TaxID=2771356 RepID=A0ABR8JDS7_9BACT|nr:OmpA family protein [Hymenobacter duratus]MBD2713846.1 OmpA family protein [Hymenobacter duratus]MBR7948748.1 OmpA family protein [Microvirga sp. STR05]